jgi:hypothetical protein
MHDCSLEYSTSLDEGCPTNLHILFSVFLFLDGVYRLLHFAEYKIAMAIVCLNSQYKAQEMGRYSSGRT